VVVVVLGEFEAEDARDGRTAAAGALAFLDDGDQPVVEETGEGDLNGALGEAGEGGEAADATAVWPETREQAEFGTLTLTERVDELAPERRKIIFDPLPRVDGIDTAGDPLTEVRSDLYLLSGRRRRQLPGWDRSPVRRGKMEATRSWRLQVQQLQR